MRSRYYFMSVNTNSLPFTVDLSAVNSDHNKSGLLLCPMKTESTCTDRSVSASAAYIYLTCAAYTLLLMSFVTLLVAVLLFSSVLSQAPSNPQEWTYKHIFGVSEHNLFADSLNTPEQRHGKEALRFLLKYYGSLPEKMSKGNVQRRTNLPPSSLNNALNFYGFPPLENNYNQVYEPEKPVSDGTRTSAEIIKDQKQYEERIKSFR
eukprot:IDg5781t1